MCLCASVPGSIWAQKITFLLSLHLLVVHLFDCQFISIVSITLGRSLFTYNQMNSRLFMTVSKTRLEIVVVSFAWAYFLGIYFSPEAQQLQESCGTESLYACVRIMCTNTAYVQTCISFICTTYFVQSICIYALLLLVLWHCHSPSK